MTQKFIQQQQTNSVFYWNNKHSLFAMGMTYVFFSLSYFLFGSLIAEFYWLISAFLIIGLFFFGISFFQRQWEDLPSIIFARKLFWMSILIHLLVMVLLTTLAFFEPNWPELEYVGANDAVTFNRQAAQIADLIRQGSFSEIFPTLYTFYGAIDNYGVPLIVGIIYSIFGSHILVGKLFYVLVASGSVVLIYKLTRLLWPENIAKLSAIIWMLFPYSWFWSVVIRKEELVVFFVLLATYLVIKSINEKRFNLLNSFLIILSLIMIFYLRTLAGIVLVVLIPITYFFNQVKGQKLLAIGLGGFIIIIFFVFAYYYQDIDFYLSRALGSEEALESRMRSVLRVNRLGDIVGTPFFVILSWTSPFSSIVYIDNLIHDVSHSHRHYVIGGLIVWNMLASISLIGLWKVIKNRPKETIIIWGFPFIYTIALGLTGLFTSIRHPYIAMPFKIILIAVGLHYLRNKSLIILSIVVGTFLILAWNIFRAAGRGALFY